MRREGPRPHGRGDHEAPQLHRLGPPGGGRPAPRALPGDQAPAGDWRVPRRSPPARPARERPAHEDERTHAQGPVEDRGPRQEGADQDLMAPPRNAPASKGRTRRRVKKNIAIGQAHIKTSFNNTIVTLTDKDGAVIAWESAGSARFKRPASRSSASRTSPRRPTIASGPRSAGASSGPLPGTQVQAVPPGGHEALPQGRALPDREVRGRAAQLSAGRARARAHQAVGVPPPAA